MKDNSKEKMEEAKVEEPKVMNATMAIVDENETNYKDLYIRTLADMDNLRKNTAKQISNTYLMANEKLIKEMLPYLDSLDLAISHHSNEKNNGYEVLRKQLLDTLAKFGVKEIEIKVAEQFDESRMNAIMSMPTQEDELRNTVYDVTKKGYTLNGNVLRYADVVVYSAA